MENNTLGKYVRRNEFARTAANLPGISAGTRIATPVCALVRNDMQKEGRVRGGKNVARNDMQKLDRHLRGNTVVRNDMQKIAALLRVQEGAAGASPQPPTNWPYVLLISTRLCGAGDCHVASLLAMTGKNLLRVRTARTHLGRNVVHFTRAWRCASLPGLWMSLRGAGRPPRDVAIRSPAAAHNERQYLGRIRSSLRIRLKCYFSLPFPAGTRIAASLRSSQ